jgi:hypothetical protein
MSEKRREMLDLLSAAHAQLTATVKAQKKLAQEHTMCEDKLRRIAAAEKEYKQAIKGVEDGVAARTDARNKSVSWTTRRFVEVFVKTYCCCIQADKTATRIGSGPCRGVSATAKAGEDKGMGNGPHPLSVNRLIPERTRSAWMCGRATVDAPGISGSRARSTWRARKCDQAHGNIKPAFSGGAASDDWNSHGRSRCASIHKVWRCNCRQATLH